MIPSSEIPRLPKKKSTNKKPVLSEEQNLFSQDFLDEKTSKQIIRGMNLKVTDQRLQILQTLHQGRRHVSAQEVYELVIEKFPEVGFATVYRFLRDLVDHKIVTEVRMGGQPARYELTPRAHHDHLTCVKCSKICEFENEEIERLQEVVAQQFGFRLTSHVLELYGICTDCQREESHP
jgi:Fur family ferric uptake transcriptional regulator